MLININLPITSIILFSVAFVAVLYIIIIYGHRLRVVRRRRRECNAEAESISYGPLPKASIVVYVNDSAEVLEQALLHMLSQQYPGDFEIIVVNDAPSNDVDTLVTRLKNTYDNLYLTFTPDTSRNVSQRKLAITLGVKAARGEVVVVTDATTRVGSDRWLERMMLPFVDQSVEVVTGYNAPLLTDGSWSGRITRWYDIAADDVTWLSRAICGKPYRACGNCLAYRKSTFFRNKGFSRSLNKRCGDDDIFVNEIASNSNTVVELSDAALGVWGNEEAMPKRMRRYRLNHAFTGLELPRGPRVIMALGSWMMWIALACAVAGAIIAGIYSIVGWGIAAVLILAMIISVIVMWRKTLRSLSGPRLSLSLVWLTAMRPLRNLLLSLRSRSSKNANYTWQ